MKETASDGMVCVVNSDDKEPIVYGDILNPYANREKNMENIADPDDPFVSIYFQAYNHLDDYTKPAIEALFRYTQGIDYELILVDNGSSDGTFEYFKSIVHPRKRIYRITKNIGAFYGYFAAKNATRGRFIRGKYFVSVPNDVLVTENWLRNMLICAESDERIGFLVPASDNVSNGQRANIKYTDFTDMQKKAALFNQSDPSKWYDRIRLIPTVCMIRTSLREFYEADYAFYYNFADDDISFAYRRLGYRNVLCGDVFVHHEGSTVVGADPVKQAEDLAKGRRLFQQKYCGIDAWSDVINYEESMLDILLHESELLRRNSPHILGVDVRCGTPLLEVKNMLRSRGISDASLAAYTTAPKYWQDLYYVCEGEAFCGDADRVKNKAGGHTYDAIILGEFPDTYENPIALIQDLTDMLSDGGVLALKVRYYDVSEDLQEIANALRDTPPKVSWHVDALIPLLEQMNYEIRLFPYMEFPAEMKRTFFDQLASIEEYHTDVRMRALYSEERFDTLMTKYVILLRKTQ